MTTRKGGTLTLTLQTYDTGIHIIIGLAWLIGLNTNRRRLRSLELACAFFLLLIVVTVVDNIDTYRLMMRHNGICVE